MQLLDMTDSKSVEAHKAEHYLDDEKFAALQSIKTLDVRQVQDYRSTYNNIRDWLPKLK